MLNNRLSAGNLDKSCTQSISASTSPVLVLTIAYNIIIRDRDVSADPVTYYIELKRANQEDN
jgi:hypothetical protein